MAEPIRSADSSSGSAECTYVGSSPGRDTCVLEKDTETVIGELGFEFRGKFHKTAGVAVAVAILCLYFMHETN